MATVTLLGTATFTTANGTKTVTATPALNDLIIIIAAHTGNTATTAPTDNNNSGTYSLINTAVKASSADTMKFWVRDQLIQNPVSTIFTHAPGTTSGGGIVVLKITGVSRYSALAVRQSAISSNLAASSTPTPVLSSAALTGNAIIGACFNATNPATLTPRASYTEIVDAGYNNPTTGIEVMTRNSGETATSIAWGSTSSSISCTIVVEINNDTMRENLACLGVG